MSLLGRPESRVIQVDSSRLGALESSQVEFWASHCQIEKAQSLVLQVDLAGNFLEHVPPATGLASWQLLTNINSSVWSRSVHAALAAAIVQLRTRLIILTY